MLRVSWRRARSFPSIHQAMRGHAQAATAPAIGAQTHETTPVLQPHPVTVPAPHTVMKHGLKLRPYQEECVQSVLKAFEEGRRQVGVSLATGAGKTVIFTELVSRMAPPNPDATQTLILVHRQELVEQAARHCSSRYPSKTVEIEMGNMHATGTADITVASVQSINSRDRIAKFDARRFKLILVDEAHHIVASSYLRVLSHFGLQSEIIPSTAPALVGVSATFGRHDGLAIGKAIKHIVYHKDYVDMIGESWLSNVIFTAVKSQARLSSVKTSKATGDFLSSSLSAAVNTPEINLVTVRAWLHRAYAEGRKSTLVFCVDLAHLTSLTATFRAHGIDARFITGDTRRQTRAERLNAFRRGEFPVLLNCGVFTEGTDIPNIDCVLLARPTKSRNLLVQMIGRGMRLHPGKKNCHIIDMVASLDGGIVTTPSLFGLDPDFAVEAASRQDLQKAKERKERENARDEVTDEISHAMAGATLDRDVTFTEYDSVSDLISDTSAERHIRALSQNAWVNVGSHRYVLTGGAGGSFLVLELDESDSLYRVRYTASIPSVPSGGKSRNSPYMRPRLIGTAETLEAGVRAADNYASKVFVQRLTTTRMPAAAWRRGPATAAQLAQLNRFRQSLAAGDKDGQGPLPLLEAGDVTKGEAADALTKLKFGARGRFAALRRLAARRVRQQAADERQERRQQAGVVRVGPVPMPVPEP